MMIFFLIAFLSISSRFIDCNDNNLRHHQSKSLLHRKIYFDFGTNTGESMLTFIQNVNSAAPSFSTSVATDGANRAGADFFKDVDSLSGFSKWEVYAFEPNSRYITILNDTKNKILDTYSNITQSVDVFINSTVTTHNGLVTFILDNNNSGDAGSTVEIDSFSAVGTKIITKAYDIIDIFHNIVKVKLHDYVVVKMDVEGHEYELVRRMMLYGLLPYTDKIAVEWHHENFWVFGGPGYYNETNADEVKKAEARVAINTKYKNQYDHIMWMIEADPRVKAKFCDWGR